MKDLNKASMERKMSQVKSFDDLANGAQIFAFFTRCSLGNHPSHKRKLLLPFIGFVEATRDRQRLSGIQELSNSEQLAG